jgi:uncharacterized protein DUF5666
MQAILLGVSFALLSVIWWPTPYALAADTKVARGTVVAIGGSTLSVKVRGQEMKFSVDPNTVVEARGAGTKTRAAQAKGHAGPKLGEVITVGQAVAVTYNEIDGVLHASVVRAISAIESDGGSAEPASMTASGTVRSIGANSLTINGAGGGGATFTQTFVIDGNTKVFAKGAGTAAAAKGGRVPFTEVVGSGDRVNVSYRKLGDRLLASDVRVTMKGMH